MFDAPVDAAAGDGGEDEPPARPPRTAPRKLGAAMLIGMARALGQIYDPKPPTEIAIEQEAGNDEPDPDQPVHVELGITPATSVARVRRG